MNPRVLLRSSQHPSSATGALPSQPARQLLRSSVSQSLVHRLLQSGSGVGGGTSPSAQFQNSFLFASAGGSKARGKTNTSSVPKKRTGDKKDAECGIRDKDGVNGGGENVIKVDEKKEEKREGKSVLVLVETLEKEPLPLYPQKTLSANVKGELFAAPLITLKLPTNNNEYVVLLVNPKNPLSALSKLIQAELPPLAFDPSKAPRVTFKAPEHTSIGGGSTRWGSSVEVGDFLKDAARAKEFVIEIEGAGDITISVPSFSERSQSCRDQLRKTTQETNSMGKLRDECDRALRNRMNIVVVGMVGWLVVVYSFMLNTGFLWSVGPNVVSAGLWTMVASWLYFGTFEQTKIENRQQRLYESRGFNQEQLVKLVEAGRVLRKEILDIAEQYGEKWDESRDLV